MLVAVAQLRIVVLDRPRAFADVLGARLDLEDDVAVVGVVHSVGAAMGLMVGGRADIILLDGDWPGDAAFSLCEEMSGRNDAPRVVMLSDTSEAARIVQAVRASAAAWVRKDESMDQLLRVVRGVARGETWRPPAEMGQVLRMLMRERDERSGNDQLFASLTPREREVLFHLAEGAGRHDVAELLHLSANTVRTHLQSLMAKLGVHSTLEAVALTRSRLDQLAPGGWEGR